MWNVMTTRLISARSPMTLNLPKLTQERKPLNVVTARNLSTRRPTWLSTRRHTQERNPVEVIYLEKPFRNHSSQTLCILRQERNSVTTAKPLCRQALLISREHSQKGSFMCVTSAGSLSVIAQPSKSIREFTRERSPTSVINVGRPSASIHSSLNTRESIPGRNSTSVWSVGRPIVTDQTCADTRKFTQKKNSINGRTMGSHLSTVLPLLSIRDSLEQISLVKFNSSLK